MKESLLDKLDRKIGKYAPKYIMTIIVIGTAIVWALEYFVAARTGIWISWYLMFDKAAILQGQVWRVVTFLFVPDEYNPVFLAISLYFYWMIGNALEKEWGAFKFDLFYFCGVLCTIGAGFITGYASVFYLNLSLFLAFAILYPDYQVLLFFFIPVKMKWLAIVDAVSIVLLLIFNTWAGRIAIFVALFNLILFLTGIVVRRIIAWRRKKKWQQGLYVVEDEPYKEERSGEEVFEEVPKRKKKKEKKQADDDPFEL